jgi:hypothetical protein
MTKKKNVWDSLEDTLRLVFPYPYPETNWKGEPIEDDDLEDYYESKKDPLVTFLIGNGIPKSTPKSYLAIHNIEFVEFEGSFYENLDYDSIPQGTEDECSSVIKVGEQFYKVGLIFTSYSGYRLNWTAYEVSPKTIEVTIYE